MEKEQANNIPDIDIIDLDDNDTFFDESSLTGENDDIPESDTETDINDEDSNSNAPQKKGFRLNIHVILLASVLIVICVVIFRFKNWGQFISQEEIRDNIEGTLENELDLILPLTD